MPNDYTDHPFDVPSLPTAVNIASSTNTSPIQVTTSTPHGCETGESVMINGHLLNLAANGPWEIVKVSTTVLILVGSTGNGVGGATGTLHLQDWGYSIAVVADGDDPVAAVLAVSPEALQDRTAMLLKIIGWQQYVHAGGRTTFEASAGLIMAAGSFATVHGDWAYQSDWTGTWGAGSVGLHLGLDRYVSGAEVVFENGSDVVFGNGSETLFVSGSALSVNTAATVDGAGSITVKNHGVGTTGFLKLEANALLRVDAGATLNMAGTETIQSGGQFTLAVGSEADFNGEIERSGPLNISGADACTGVRIENSLNADQTFFAHAFDWILVADTIDTSRVYRLATPLDAFQKQCDHVVRISSFGFAAGDLKIKDDDSNTLLVTLGVGDVGIWYFAWDHTNQAWKYIARGAQT
jgi:hypothetical protein